MIYGTASHALPACLTASTLAKLCPLYARSRRIVSDMVRRIRRTCLWLQTTGETISKRMNEKKEIIHIENNISPDTYPKVFFPLGKSLYVLETNVGFALRNNLLVGKVLNFTQN